MLNLDVNAIASDCFEKLDSGELDGVDILVFAKKLGELSEILKSSEEVKDNAINELEKYSKGEVCTRGGYKITYYTSSKYVYDFDEYRKLKGVIKEITENKIKPLENIAKSLFAQGVESAFFPNEDGEQIEVRAAQVDPLTIFRIQEAG